MLKINQLEWELSKANKELGGGIEMSKGLEDLKWLIESGYIKLHNWQEDVVMLDCVDNIEKELKAFEIIKEKDVRIYTIKNMGLSCYGYNNLMINDSKRLTQEEYDLLKEVLS